MVLLHHYSIRREERAAFIVISLFQQVVDYIPSRSMGFYVDKWGKR
jgi:hypothetical protein